MSWDCYVSSQYNEGTNVLMGIYGKNDGLQWACEKKTDELGGYLEKDTVLNIIKVIQEQQRQGFRIGSHKFVYVAEPVPNIHVFKCGPMIAQVAVGGTFVEVSISNEQSDNCNKGMMMFHQERLLNHLVSMKY